MIVIINGAFGVGKSTVAEMLRRDLPGSSVYDPEWAGLALRSLAKLVRLKGSGTDDFQDIDLWRKITVEGVRLSSQFHPGYVVVPMTFTHRGHFDEVIGTLRSHGHEVRVFCLKASQTSITQRLDKRGLKDQTAEADWIKHRNLECLTAHEDPHFGEPVNTENRSAREVAEYITAMLSRPNAWERAKLLQ